MSCDIFFCLVDVSYSCNIDMFSYGRNLDMWISPIEGAVGGDSDDDGVYCCCLLLGVGSIRLAANDLTLFSAHDS